MKNNENFESLKLTIYDLQGRIVIVQNIKNKSERIDATNLSKGIYIAEIAIENKKYTSKLIIE